MKQLLMCVTVGALLAFPVSAQPILVGDVELELGATAEEVVAALPEGLALSEEVRDADRDTVDLLEGGEHISILTFDEGRLVRSTRILEPQDFTDTPSEQLVRTIVAVLASWPPGETVTTEASHLESGDETLQELVFHSGLRRLIVVRSGQLTQVVEHIGTIDD